MTIVNRRTFNVVPGRVEELLSFIQEEEQKMNWVGPVRLYTSHTGRFSTVVVEYEFASLAEYEKFWAEWFASDHAAAFMPKWYELTVPGGSNELYEKVAEFG